eukprot:Hpha_TRINITY_DN28087_c0_g1::TRINITY_DN28087_c0_g1_i1::g.42606::m.42606
MEGSIDPLCSLSAELITDAPGLAEHLQKIHWPHIISVMMRRFAAVRPEGKQDVLDSLNFSLRTLREEYPPGSCFNKPLSAGQPPADIQERSLKGLKDTESGLLGRQWVGDYASETPIRVRVEAVECKRKGGEEGRELYLMLKGWMETQPKKAQYLQRWVGIMAHDINPRLVSLEPAGASMRSINDQLKEAKGRGTPLELDRVVAWMQ